MRLLPWDKTHLLTEEHRGPLPLLLSFLLCRQAVSLDGPRIRKGSNVTTTALSRQFSALSMDPETANEHKS